MNMITGLAVLLVLGMAGLVLIPLLQRPTEGLASDVPGRTDEQWVDLWLDAHFCGECGSVRTALEVQCAQCGAHLMNGEERL